MARPRLHSTDALLDACERVVSRSGGASWSLAQVAEEAGVTAPALSQRFGTRKGLLLALGERWVQGVPVDGSRVGEPLAELRAWVRATWGPLQQGPAASVTALASDLADPDLTGVLRRGWRAQEAYVAALLAAAGLPRAPAPAEAAAVLLGLVEGCVLRTLVDRTGTGPAADPTDPAGPTDLLDLLDLALDTLLDGWTRP